MLDEVVTNEERTLFPLSNHCTNTLSNYDPIEFVVSREDDNTVKIRQKGAGDSREHKFNIVPNEEGVVSIDLSSASLGEGDDNDDTETKAILKSAMIYIDLFIENGLANELKIHDMENYMERRIRLDKERRSDAVENITTKKKERINNGKKNDVTDREMKRIEWDIFSDLSRASQGEFSNARDITSLFGDLHPHSTSMLSHLMMSNKRSQSGIDQWRDIIPSNEKWLMPLALLMIRNYISHCTYRFARSDGEEREFKLIDWIHNDAIGNRDYCPLLEERPFTTIFIIMNLLREFAEKRGLPMRTYEKSSSARRLIDFNHVVIDLSGASSPSSFTYHEMNLIMSHIESREEYAEDVRIGRNMVVLGELLDQMIEDSDLSIYRDQHTAKISASLLTIDPTRVHSGEREENYEERENSDDGDVIGESDITGDRYGAMVGEMMEMFDLQELYYLSQSYSKWNYSKGEGIQITTLPHKTPTNTAYEWSRFTESLSLFLCMIDAYLPDQIIGKAGDAHHSRQNDYHWRFLPLMSERARRDVEGLIFHCIASLSKIETSEMDDDTRRIGDRFRGANHRHRPTISNPRPFQPSSRTHLNPPRTPPRRPPPPPPPLRHNHRYHRPHLRLPRIPPVYVTPPVLPYVHTSPPVYHLPDLPMYIEIPRTPMPLIGKLHRYLTYSIATGWRLKQGLAPYYKLRDSHTYVLRDTHWKSVW